ncbi:MAG: (2Fe-2S) ferredoxin domain-containing protein [Pseudomonadota bacterium]|nr:(2Fe-2S) ferredoxin domain-containing protein [Pseudomonadota bacterium]
MPRPQKHVFVCTQSRPPGHPRGSCGSKGCAAVYEAFLQTLQQRNLFATIQVTAAGCLGPCGEGPNVLVYPEGVMYAPVSVPDVAEIFDEHLTEDRVVERLLIAPGYW